MFSKTESTKAKGIAILLLLFHHLFYNPLRIENSGIQFMIVPQEIMQMIGVSARICVWIFVFVSAYGLTFQYIHRKEENKIQFLVRRWISLMSPYWYIYVVALIICFFISKNIGEIYQNHILYAVLDFMAWSDFFGTNVLTGGWWYMCFAQILVLAIPFVNCICEKLGWSSYLLVFIIMQYLPDGIQSPYGGRYSNYFLVTILAVLCARNQIFDSILRKKNSKIKEAVIFFLSLSAIVLLLIIKLKISEQDMWQINSLLSSMAAFLICYVTCAFLKNKVLSNILFFLGRHSGNIFLCHSFLIIYFPKWIYWSKHAVFSFLTLLLLSVMFSLLFEHSKKLIHYNEYMQKLLIIIKKQLYMEEGNS